MKVQFFKDKIYCGVNKYIPYYYAAIERTTNGGKLKEHEVLFSAHIDGGISRREGIYRRPSKECVEITEAEFKKASKKVLEQMFNNFNI